MVTASETILQRLLGLELDEQLQAAAARGLVRDGELARLVVARNPRVAAKALLATIELRKMRIEQLPRSCDTCRWQHKPGWCSRRNRNAQGFEDWHYCGLWKAKL